MNWFFDQVNSQRKDISSVNPYAIGDFRAFCDKKAILIRQIGNRYGNELILREG